MTQDSPLASTWGMILPTVSHRSIMLISVVDMNVTGELSVILPNHDSTKGERYEMDLRLLSSRNNKINASLPVRNGNILHVHLSYDIMHGGNGNRRASSNSCSQG